MLWVPMTHSQDLRTVIQEISDMTKRKKIAFLAEPLGLMPFEAQNSFHLIMRILEQSYDIVSINRDTPIDQEIECIILPSKTEEKVFITEYFRTNYSEIFHYSIFESGELRIELLEWRKDDPYDGLLREYESSMTHRCSEKNNIAVFMTLLLSKSLPNDCTRLCDIDYFPCFPNDEEELDLSIEPEYKESYFDASGKVILEKHGRKSVRDDYIFYDDGGRFKMEITCWLNELSPYIKMQEWSYELDEMGRIAMVYSVTTKLPSGEKDEFHWQNRWKRDGSLVHCKCDDNTKEMTSLRPDGKVKHIIYLPETENCGRIWKWEHFFKYNQAGVLISEKTKCYRKKASEESDEERVEVSYTYYGEDGRAISGKHHQLKGAYLNDKNGNWIQYIERSPNGNITDLIIRSIHYGKGDFFIDTEHNLIHKKILEI